MMNKILAILFIVLNISCSIEYTKGIEDQKINEIIENNYPELLGNGMKVSLVNDTLKLVFPYLKEKIFNEISNLKEYKIIRKSAKEIFVKLPVIPNTNQCQIKKKYISSVQE